MKAGMVLKRARKRAKLSQGALAEKMGYGSPQFVSNWERELCSVPAEKASMFCQITGMSFKELRGLIIDFAVMGIDRRLTTGIKAAAKKKAA